MNTVEDRRRQPGASPAVLLLMGALLTTGAFAQDQGAEEGVLEEITVTGARIRQNPLEERLPVLSLLSTVCGVRSSLLVNTMWNTWSAGASSSARSERSSSADSRSISPSNSTSPWSDGWGSVAPASIGTEVSVPVGSGALVIDPTG